MNREIDFKNLRIKCMGPARTTLMKLANSERYVEVENPEYTKLKMEVKNGKYRKKNDCK